MWSDTGEKHKARTTMKYQVIDDAIRAVNEGRSIPKRIGDFSLSYVATDGWRGYYEVKASKKSGWREVDADWMTGNWEDAGEHAASTIEEKLDKLADEHLAKGEEMAVVFTPTSNVFSVSFSVFVRNKK